MPQKKSEHRYGPKAQEKVGKVMHELKMGTLKSGSGQKVTSQEQAIAIGLSEARRERGKVPPAPKGPKGTASRTTSRTRSRSSPSH